MRWSSKSSGEYCCGRVNPSQLLSDDVHRHEAIDCALRKAAYDPWTRHSSFTEEANRQRVMALNPNEDFYEVSIILENQFYALSNAEKHMWEKLAKRTIQDAVKLFGICSGLWLVSKHWQNVMGDLMNSQAPIENVAPRDLFQLKRRALSLSLPPACKKFVENVQVKWGSEQRHDDDRSGSCAILDMIIPHYGGSLQGFSDLVAGEYVKFLVVKCVEIAASKSGTEAAPSIQMWRKRTSRISSLSCFGRRICGL